MADNSSPYVLCELLGLLIFLCFLLSSQTGDFVHTLGDAHVYINHIEPLKIQVRQVKTL